MRKHDFKNIVKLTAGFPRFSPSRRLSRLGGKGDILLIDGASLLSRPPTPPSHPPPPDIFHLPSLPVNPSSARHTYKTPPPSLKTRIASKQFSLQLPQRLRIAKAPLQLSTSPPLPAPCPAPLPPIPYDTLCMCSLTAVYIKQYIYQNGSCILCM